MSRFKSTNVIVNFDETVTIDEDPITKQPVHTTNPERAAQKYESDVTSTLEIIYNGSRVGRLLFDEIQRAGYDFKSGKNTRYLVISPYPRAAEKKDLCNAYAGPNEYDNSATTKRWDGDGKEVRKGVGSTTTIRWDKARWVNGTKCGMYGGQPGGAYHDILMHEMLHGLRQMAGQQDMSNLPNGWTSMEEFYAILIANVSMSERGITKLRKNHNGFGELERTLSTSEGFLTDLNHLKWINWLHSTNAVFLKRVGDVPAPFNPIQEFLANVPVYKAALAKA
jgi:hypothetical protein